MLSKGRIGMRVKLGLQCGVLGWRNGAAAPVRGAWSQVGARALLRKQALDGANTDAKRGHHVLAWHATRDSSQHALPKINGVSFHNAQYATGSVLVPTAVGRVEWQEAAPTQARSWPPLGGARSVSEGRDGAGGEHMVRRHASCCQAAPGDVWAYIAQSSGCATCHIAPGTRCSAALADNVSVRHPRLLCLPA